VDVLDVQVSRYSGPDQISLTINVGIWMRTVWIINSGKKARTFIEEHDCWPSFRIGQVMADFGPDALDAWWKLTSEDDVERVGIELCSKLSEKCLPFVNRFNTLEDVKAFYDAKKLRLMPGGKLYLAILNYLLGDREGYERLMADFADKKLSAWRPRVAEVIQRLENL
jgi:hypothetical protein